jgi:hypothetical protein
MGRRLIGFAIVSGLIVAGTAELSAQGTPGVSPRPFSRVFDQPSASPEVPEGLREAMRKALQALPKPPSLPSGTRCDIVVVPADPRLDPRMAIAPPDPRRFTMRLVPTERFCR